MRGMPFGVKRVTVLRRGPYDEAWDQIVWEDSRVRPGSKRLKRAERVIRRLVTANANMAALYLERHDKSNRRKEDGWLRDIRRNVRLAREDVEDHRQLMALPGEDGGKSRPRVIARIRIRR
jgi:hypothetical protein